MKLDVGGKCFHVASETLAGMSFFEPLLEGKFAAATSESGHFIDRCGELFAIILQAHRTMQRPAQPMIDLHRMALLTECDYYGADHVAAMIRGETNPCHLRREDREIREEELAGNAALIDVFETDFTGHSPEELQMPLLFHREENRMPKPCASMATFESHFRSICGSAADALLSIPNVVFAGSSVLSAFLDKSSDEDLNWWDATLMAGRTGLLAGCQAFLPR